MSFHLLDLNVLFDLTSGAVALLVSYYAFHYNGLIENATLKYISFGFMLLGVGLLAETSVESLVIYNIGDIYTQRYLALGSATIYDFLEISAYLVFAFGYARSAFSTPLRQVAGAVSILVPLVLRPPAIRLHDLFLLTHYSSFFTEIFLITSLEQISPMEMSANAIIQSWSSAKCLLKRACIVNAGKLNKQLLLLTILIDLDYCVLHSKLLERKISVQKDSSPRCQRRSSHQMVLLSWMRGRTSLVHEAEGLKRLTMRSKYLVR